MWNKVHFTSTLLCNIMLPQTHFMVLTYNNLTHWGCTFLNENVSISIKISLKLVPKGPINNIPVLLQLMSWYRPSDKPFSEPMIVIWHTEKYHPAYCGARITKTFLIVWRLCKYRFWIFQMDTLITYISNACGYLCRIEFDITLTS